MRHASAGDTYRRAKSTTRVGFRVTCGAGIRPLARGVAARSGARGARTGRRRAATRQETVCAMDRCSQRVKIESPESVDREEGRRCDLERRDTPRYIRWKLVTQVSVRRILAPVTRAHAHAHPSQGSHNGTDRRIVRDCYDHQRRADTCIRSCMYERYMRNDVLDIRVHAASGQCIRYARSDVQPSRG